jgi:uncharacterized protein (TIGR00369 family)
MEFPIRIPFVETLGMQLVSMGQGRAQIHLAPRAEQCNSFGVAHGGLLMTVLDVVMAHAARSEETPEQALHTSVVTVEMKTSFMRPGRGALRGHGRLLHRGAKLAFCEGRVEDEAGQLLAHATATFKFVPAPSPSQAGSD